MAMAEAGFVSSNDMADAVLEDPVRAEQGRLEGMLSICYISVVNF